MENLGLSLGGLSPKQAPTRRHVLISTARDIWAAVRNGTLHDVEIALAYLKRSNGNIDARNAFGSNALHIAAWRNHIPIVRRLLAAGADPNTRDGESGWSSLHRALHFGHLAVAGVLIEAGGSLVLEDSKGRTPVDLTSGDLKVSSNFSRNSGAKEVFSWGNGSNYQLGICSTGILRAPGRVDVLQGLDVIAVAAAKFHCVALTASGEVYSWGFGRGGRLGHPDFDIHSGQVAVITPRLITSSFGCRGISVIAVAKHHTVVATNGGEVYTWGSNREGRLGYASVDTQPTPRRVSTLKARVVAVAAANKHTAVLTESGEVYTWGCNTEGQLGYGTSNSISNFMPRMVECLKGKQLVSVSTAKYHTVVLGAEGEVLTWGYKMVNPRRIHVVRDTKKAGSLPLKFHISERLHVVTISAGMTHSVALSLDGLVFYWFSSDPLLKCYQLLSMAGHQVTTVSSSKYRTAVATLTGDVYSWDGEDSKADTIPVPCRVHGIKHAAQLAVGENHSVVVASVFIPDYPQSTVPEMVTSSQPSSKEDDDVDVDPEFEDDLFGTKGSSPKKGQVGADDGLKTPPSLKDLCQKLAAQSILEPKNALQVLEFADSLGADLLKRYTEELILRNLDFILTVAPVSFGHVRPCLLARVEKALDACSTESWSHRQLPTPTANLPVVIDSEEEDHALGQDGLARNASVRGTVQESSMLHTSSDRRISEGFLQPSEYGESVMKQVRAVRKKLQQIEALELKQAKGNILDDQQLAKILTKRELKQVLASLEVGPTFETAKKAHRQEMKNYGDSSEKSVSVEEPPRNRTGGSRQSWRQEKKRSKSQGSNDLLQTEKDSTGTHPSQNLLLERPKFGACSDSSSVSSNFMSISGFNSDLVKRAGLELPWQSMSSLGSMVSEMDNLAHGPSVPEKHVHTPRKMIIPGPVLQSEQPPMPRKLTTLGKRVVKGGLSVFLSGALDGLPKVAVLTPDPVTPKIEGPAWGGAHVPKGLTSLRSIQSQQKTEPKLVFTQALKVGSGTSSTGERSVSTIQQVALSKMSANTKHSGKSQIVVDDTESSSSKCVPLSQFVRTSPIAVTSNTSSSILHPENSPPPWASSASSPAAVSLRDIQQQQVKSKVRQRTSHSRGSPNLSSPVGALTSPAGASSSEHTPNSVDSINRWFKPEVDSLSTLRCIQIEEKAMKELRQLYKYVKLVRNDGT